MKKHEYLPSKEYIENFNKADLGVKVYGWCMICHEHEPCKYNKELNEANGVDDNTGLTENN